MTTYSPGDIVLCPFPFTDLTDVKRRPALVVSSEEYNAAMGDVVLAPITSNLSAPPVPGDHRIQDWGESGLIGPSVVRAKLTTIDSNLFVRTLGRLPHA